MEFVVCVVEFVVCIVEFVVVVVDIVVALVGAGITNRVNLTSNRIVSVIIL